MTVKIPDEWKTAIAGKRSRARVIDDQTRAAIDAMIIQYYPTNTQRQIAKACGCSSGYVATRVLFLRDEGKIS